MNAIVITGGTRGLGAALTQHFIAKGHNVVMNYRDPDAAERMKNVCESHGVGNLTAFQADVRNRSDVQALFGRASEVYGGTDVLINCAGVNCDAPFLELTDKSWETVIDTHLKGTFICSQEFVRQIADRTGSIINLGAACGIQGRKNGANFCSAKGGILALTKCMALELAPQIRVNCLTPSAVDTEEVRERYSLDTSEGLKNVLSGIPMNRLGAHDDVTHMVDCILGAKFTTGTTFFVNGGEFLR